jgi:hypothetical protein
MKKSNLKEVLTIDLKNQLVSLRNQGKTVSQMSEITGLSVYEIRQIGKLLIEKGLWSYSERWKKRVNTIVTKSTETVKPLKTTKIKRTYNKREAKTVDSITINFKGINVEVQKSSNIIITDTVIYVK